MTRALVIIVVLAIAGRARADSRADARAHVANASKAHAAGKYTEALKELTLAYALDPQPDLLYAIGQVHMKLGDCAGATTFYQRFLDSHPDPNDAGVAREAIAKCASAKPVEPVAQPVAEPPKPIELPPAVVEPPPVTPPAPPPTIVTTTTTPWFHDSVGDALAGGGVLAGIAGALIYVAALRDRDRADSAANYQSYHDAVDSAHTDRSYAIGFAAGAGVLVTAGIVRYLVHDRHVRRVRETGVAATHGGAVVTWSTGF